MKRESVGISGKNVVLELGKMAPQAHGACVVRLGDTVLLVTAVGALEPRPGMGFFPLTVDYRVRYAAAGRIPPYRNRREGRSGDSEVLTSRVVDRSIRPLFPSGYLSEVQVIASVLSADPDVPPADLTLLGASVALHVSDIPWAGPVAGARFAREGSRLIAFPSPDALAASDLDLFVAVGPNGLVMVEGQTQEIPEDELVDVLLDASTALQPLMAVQKRLRDALGLEKRPFEPSPTPEDVRAAVAEHVGALREALVVPEKTARSRRVREVRTATLETTQNRLPDAPESVVKQAFEALQHDESRRLILEGRRADGRRPDEVRPITSEVGLLPRTHGSALFTRGETQALASATLGSRRDQLEQNGLFASAKERFYLHYNFPPFSVGETRPLRGPGRREIGHGMLAQRALSGVLPSEDDFPYTVRVVSDILSSNGSSSMATVCAGCLALMDAGVPIRQPVAGIAMGLVSDGDRAVVLTDILGDEDHVGDMDFKVCGTAAGVTALQMDIKMEALDDTLLRRAMQQARDARLHILGEMEKTLSKPRAELSPHAPRLLSIRVRPEKIRTIIGPGGSTIRGISEESGATVDVDNDGLVRITSTDLDGARRALARIEDLTREAEVGAVYAATVRKVLDKVAFVELFPGTEAAVPIAEVAEEHIARVSDVIHEGETVNVRVLGVDDRGKIRASRRRALNADPTEVRLP